MHQEVWRRRKRRKTWKRRRRWRRREEEKEEREEEEKEEEFGLRQDVTSLPATGPSLPSHLKLSLMTFLQKKSSRPSSSFPIMPFCSDSGATLAAAAVAAAWAEPR